MEILPILTEEHKAVLRQARETYGDETQILVSTEELCELAAVCTKYPRYKTQGKAQAELHQKAIDEVADVLIVLDHIINLFGLSSEELSDRISGKIDRMKRWMNASDSMEQTTVDREVVEPHRDGACEGCIMADSPDSGRCRSCIDHNNFVQKANIPCPTCNNVGNYAFLNPGGICTQCIASDGSKYEPRKGEACS